MRYPYRQPTPEERAFYDRRDQFDIKELDKIVHEKGPSNLRGNFLIQPFTGDGPEFQDRKLIQPAGATCMVSSLVAGYALYCS